MAVFSGPEIVNDGLVLCVDAANPRSYPGSGTSLSNLAYEIPPVTESYDVNYFDYISASNASTLGYTFGPTDVKGESDLSTGACSGLMTFQEAVEWVHSFGARLPTVDEVLRGAAAGSGCGYDAELIWTADSANSTGTQHFVIYGNTATYGTTTIERDVTSTAYVRYVADVDINRASPQRVYSPTLKTILENYYSTTYTTYPTEQITFTYGEPISNPTMFNGVTVENGYFVFDGVNDYIDLDKTFIGSEEFNQVALGNSSYTIESWVYNTGSPGALTAGSCIIGTNNEFGIGLQLTQGVKVNFGMRSTNNYDSVSSLQPATWYHLVGVREVGVNNRIYINAVVDRTFTIADLTVLDGANSLRMGYASGRLTTPLQGRIGVTRIYNKALSDAEVKQNFEATRTRYGI